VGAGFLFYKMEEDLEICGPIMRKDLTSLSHALRNSWTKGGNSYDGGWRWGFGR
jgi:hypothetical protein